MKRLAPFFLDVQSLLAVILLNHIRTFVFVVEGLQ